VRAAKVVNDQAALPKHPLAKAGFQIVGTFKTAGRGGERDEQPGGAVDA